MLLNQTFKTGSIAVSTLGTAAPSRPTRSNNNAFVARRRMSKPVITAGDSMGGESRSPGWLESKISRVTSYISKKLHHGEGKSTPTPTPTPPQLESTVELKGTATVVKKLKALDLMDPGADMQDDLSEQFHGKHVSIQLMSGEIDPSTGKGKLSDKVNFAGWVTVLDSLIAKQIKFEPKFTVPKTFGTPVAIVVTNTHPNEFLLESFTLDFPDKSVPAHYLTNSWVFNTEKTNPIGARIFFHNKAYLPGETPAALKALREKELHELRGDGTGERVISDRIYDYAFYDDLGRPDDAEKLKITPEKADRQPLGGSKEFPFPRRMRTGRPRTKFNPRTESRVDGNFYVPSDERFDYRKESDNKADLLRAGGHIAKTKVAKAILKKTTFKSLDQVKDLYAPKGEKTATKVLPGNSDDAAEDAAVRKGMRSIAELMSERADGEQGRTFLFPIPQILKEDANAWETDSEFARENLAGFNPIAIKRVTEFPIKSTLNPAEFGRAESAICAKDVEGKLEGLSIDQALSEKKLFTVDHHDTFLPWVARINALKESKTYASRVLFFLSKDETLKILAIELVLPPTTGGDKISQVFTPPEAEDSSEKKWLWVLAKAHAINNEMTMHQAVSHFTLCHAVTEPAIIAAHRHLSKLHPLMHLMHPHFKHTLTVNSTARMNLLPCAGTIEKIYTPREYVVQLASAYYRDNWTFEKNALPADLINRGMAVSDPKSKYGVKLAIEDYPYAADGLELWTAMKAWHREYINIFYKDDAAVVADPELKNWWTEYRNVGHGDKKDAPGWPELNSKESLAEILTTVIWICTAMHAPINFGQYDYAAWMPQHPSITRKLIPEEGSPEWEKFQANPEKFWLSMISDTDTTVTAMAVFEVVAAHAPDEEYIGGRTEGWTASEQVKAAFQSYKEKLLVIDDHIVNRNKDKNLKNRCGVGNFPFQLLRPFSAPGVTGMGVPNSITV